MRRRSTLKVNAFILDHPQILVMLDLRVRVVSRSTSEYRRAHSSPDSRSEAMIVLKGLDAYMRPGVGEHPNPARVHDGPPVPMDGVDEPAGTVEDPCLGDRGGSARQDREPARKYPDLGQAVGRALRPQAAAVVVELDEDRSGAREVHGYLLNPPVRVRQ